MVQRDTLTSISELKISKGKKNFLNEQGIYKILMYSMEHQKPELFTYSITFQSGLNKGCSNKPTAVNKRTANVSAGGGGAQNPGVVRDAATTSIATVPPQPTAAAVGKGAVAPQDKAGNCYLYIVFGVPILFPPQMNVIITFLKNLEFQFT